MLDKSTGPSCPKQLPAASAVEGLHFESTAKTKTYQTADMEDNKT